MTLVTHSNCDLILQAVDSTDPATDQDFMVATDLVSCRDSVVDSMDLDTVLASTEAMVLDLEVVTSFTSHPHPLRCFLLLPLLESLLHHFVEKCMAERCTDLLIAVAAVDMEKCTVDPPTLTLDILVVPTPAILVVPA